VEIDQVNILINALINSMEIKRYAWKPKNFYVIAHSLNRPIKKKINFWPLPELQET